MQRHGWNLLFHDGLIEQLQKQIIIFMAMTEAQTYLAKRQARADLTAFDAVMARTGGEPPREGDRILTGQDS
jgi:hypothetical protein